MLFFVQAAMNAAARASLQRESERRAQFSTDRFEPRIRNIQVVLRDVNGPRGGAFDKVCRVTAKLRQGGRLDVMGRGRNFVSAIASAFERLRHTLAKRLSRDAVSQAKRRQQKGEGYDAGI